MPVFVRAGAIIPMAENLQNTSEYDFKNIKLVSFEADSITYAANKFLYSDNGKTPNPTNYQLLNLKITSDGRPALLSPAPQNKQDLNGTKIEIRRKTRGAFGEGTYEWNGKKFIFIPAK